MSIINGIAKNPYIKVGNEVYRIITPVNFYRLLELPENLVRKEIGEILNKVREDKKKMKVVKMIGLPIKAKYTMLDLAMVKAYKRIKGTVDYDINLTNIIISESKKFENARNLITKIYNMIKPRYEKYYLLIFAPVDALDPEMLECNFNGIDDPSFKKVKSTKYVILYKKYLYLLSKLYFLILGCINNSTSEDTVIKFVNDILNESKSLIKTIDKKYFMLVPQFEDYSSEKQDTLIF